MYQLSFLWTFSPHLIHVWLLWNKWHQKLCMAESTLVWRFAIFQFLVKMISQVKWVFLTEISPRPGNYDYIGIASVLTPHPYDVYGLVSFFTQMNDVLPWRPPPHYSDVIMSTMASQITSLTIVYSTVYSGADKRTHQSPASLAFVRGIHRWPVNSPHKGPVTPKCFHLMTSSCTHPPREYTQHLTSRHHCGLGTDNIFQLHTRRNKD